MKINWTVRFNNPVFIWQLIGSIILPILAYMGMEATQITSWAILGNILFEAVKNPYVLTLVIMSVYNCITDPTTKGISDSNRAMTYIKPSDGSDDIYF